jgi:hypothetical protein
MGKVRTEIPRFVYPGQTQVFTHRLDSDDFTIPNMGSELFLAILILIQDFHTIVNHTENIYNISIQVHPTTSNDLFQSHFEVWEPGFSIFKTCTRG